MDKTTRARIEDLRSEDRSLQSKAYFHVLAATEKRVDWAYEVWDHLLEGLRHPDHHVRAISAQVLANLARSDPKERMLKDFAALLAVTRDERFVTARHCLQSLWKVGAAGKKQQKVYMDGLARRFRECAREKNCTLIRFDILQSMRSVYDAVGDETIKARALQLIETEKDLKYRRKYAGLWRKA
jgi:hypothetical protein